MKRILLVLVTALIFVSGCSKKEKKIIPFSTSSGDSASVSQTSTAIGTNVTGATLSQITVSPADQSIAKDTHANYTATAVYTDGTIRDITNDATWTVKTETDKVSSVGTKKGRFIGTSATNTAQVSASYESIYGNANLKVTNATLATIEVSSVSSLASGGTAQYVATGVFSDGTTQDVSSLVTWTSSAPQNVTVEATTGIGTGGTSGSAVITATLTSPSTFPTAPPAVTTVTVATTKTISSITISGVPSLAAGTTSNFTATAIYSDGTSEDITNQVTWSLNNNSNASINDAIGSKGVLTSITTGSVTVQATYLGMTGTKSITVSDATVTSVSVSPLNASIAKGTTTQFTAIAHYSDGSTRDVTNSAVWSSSSASVGVDTSTSTGGLAQGISVGAATITATIGGKSGAATLNVSPATLVSIAIDNNASIAKGTTKQYTATGTYTDNSTQIITSSVSWSSTSTSNVSIRNDAGFEGLAKGEGIGSSTIQAALTNGATLIYSNTSTLSVSVATLTSITISATAPVVVGSTYQYNAIGTYSDGTTQDITSSVTWSSGTPSNASINSVTGEVSGLVAGTTNISASLPNGANGISTTSGGTVTSNASVLTVSAVVVTPPPVAVSGVTLEVSSGTSTETKPTGAFDGALLVIGDENTKGFVANITGGTLHTCANAACLMDKILQAISEDDSDFNGTDNTNSILESDSNGGYNLVTRKVVSGAAIPTEIASIEIKVNTTKTLPETSGSAPYSVNDMRNHYVNLVGKVDGSGTITDLPGTGSGSATSTTFRIEIQASKDGSNTLIMLGITSTSNFNTVEIPLTSLVNGTNIAPSSYNKTGGSKNFESSGPAKVDFLISVNNSATMEGEQTGLKSSLTDFYARLASLGVDFRMSVVTSDCNALWRSDTVNPKLGVKSKQYLTCDRLNNLPANKGGDSSNLEGISNWGTGTAYFGPADQADFTTTINNIWIRGWSRESNLLFAEMAIASGGTFTNIRSANSRSSVPMTVIVISDDPDQYNEVSTELHNWNSSIPAKTFDKDNNEFVTQNATVHAVYPMDASGNAGYCTGPNGDTQEAPKKTYADAIYPDIVTKTGGMGSTICASNPSSFMELIADQAAASASTYNLDHVPIANTLQVTVNGTPIAMGMASAGTTKFIYNSATNRISFTGTIPSVGTPIVVSYSYYTANTAMNDLTGNSELTAYISNVANNSSARGVAVAIVLLVGAILIGRNWSKRRKK